LVTPAGTQALAYVYGADNRLAEITRAGASPWTYAHDSRGNVTADGRQGYVWTDGDRLAAVPGKESYGYDALGRRVLVQRADGTGSVPMYRRDGRLHLTADNRLGGVNLHVSLGGRAIADVFHRWSDGQQTVTFLHTDALGSPILRTDAAR